MRICIISSRFYPLLVGSGTSAYIMAKELAQRGHDVHVLTDGSLRDNASHSALEFTIHYADGLEDFALGRAGIKTPLENIAEILERVNPEILHVCNFMPMLLISTLRTHTNYPIVFTFFNTPIIGERAMGVFSNTQLDTSLARFIIQTNAYDRVILGSKHYVDAAVSLGADRDKITLSYLPTDISDSADDNYSFEDIKNEYFPGAGLEDNAYLLLPSRITKQKGIIESIKAFANVVEQHDHYKLVLTGMAKPFDASYASEVANAIKAHRLTNHVIAPNDTVDRHKLGVLFRHARLVVVPSWHEGLGLAAIEAQVQGALVVASDTTGLNEVVVDGDTGLTFTPRDSDALANTLLKVINGKVANESDIVTNAKQSAQKFSTHQHIDDIEGVYADLIGRES